MNHEKLIGLEFNRYIYNQAINMLESVWKEIIECWPLSNVLGIMVIGSMGRRFSWHANGCNYPPRKAEGRFRNLEFYDLDFALLIKSSDNNRNSNTNINDFSWFNLWHLLKEISAKLSIHNVGDNQIIPDPHLCLSLKSGNHEAFFSTQYNIKIPFTKYPINNEGTIFTLDPEAHLIYLISQNHIRPKDWEEIWRSLEVLRMQGKKMVDLFPHIKNLQNAHPIFSIAKFIYHSTVPYSLRNRFSLMRRLNVNTSEDDLFAWYKTSKPIWL